jgi:putative exosortase-associated protein (TIGR04073 family)
MKKLVAVLLLSAFAAPGFLQADIQSPPGHQFNWSRKLSRGVGNLIFGPTEYLNVFQRSLRSNGVNAAFSDAIIEGTKKTLVRYGYGLFEVASFPIPAWKLTYRPPYYRKEALDPWWGYTEFAPQIGFLGQANYSRSQSW